MTQQEIQERNKDITLMLGLHHDKECVIYEMKAYTWDMLRFHSDWNWLMEAVEFINSLKIQTQTFYVSITRSNVWIYQYENHTTKCPAFSSGVLDDGKFKPLKETLFIAVSDFAKLYNDKQL
jgi:hypothetical protein